MDGGRQRSLVLLVEGDAVVGLDLSEALQQAGYRVAGPAATVLDATRVLRHEMPDLAIIEVKLEDGDCAGIADTLRRGGIPFLVHSVCPRTDPLAETFRDVPWLLKPSLPWDIIGALDDLSLANMRA